MKIYVRSFSVVIICGVLGLIALFLVRKPKHDLVAVTFRNIDVLVPRDTYRPEGAPLPLCHVDVSVLGSTKINTSIPTWDYLNQQFPMIQDGGHYRPANCRAAHTLNIIIPYRDREEHLKLFLQHMHPFLQAQMLQYTMYVVELEKGGMWKKTVLMNAAFNEITKLSKSPCFVYHDVDMLPMNHSIPYACKKGKVIHPSVYLRQFNFKVYYPNYLGGVLMIYEDDYKRVNGFSNLYCGWGGEDDDMYRRLTNMSIPIERPSSDRLRYETWSHDRHNVFTNRKPLVETAVERMRNDGLNSVNYTILRTEKKRLYTWIYLSANQSECSQKDLQPKYGEHFWNKNIKV